MLPVDQKLKMNARIKKSHHLTHWNIQKVLTNNYNDKINTREPIRSNYDLQRCLARLIA